MQCCSSQGPKGGVLGEGGDDGSKMLDCCLFGAGTLSEGGLAESEAEEEGGEAVGEEGCIGVRGGRTPTGS